MRSWITVLFLTASSQNAKDEYTVRAAQIPLTATVKDVSSVHNQCTGLASSACNSDIPTKLVGHLPALGWNTWNAYRCNISEEKIINAAEQFISLGLKDVGYTYVNIDDCWSLTERDTNTNKMVPDPIKFPNGISSVVDHVHALGLKLGIYSDAGTQTCAKYPGSLGYESIDAATWSDWGVDYLKYDNCNVPDVWTDFPGYTDWYNSKSGVRYRQMSVALAAVERPIFYSLCNWGDAHVWEWGARVGHSWRLSGDSSPTWSFLLTSIELAVAHLDTVDFGAHGDMDMMEIGNGNLTLAEQRTHFAAWAFLKSPILIGTDLSTLNSTQLDIIKNRDFLAFHQDTTVGTPAKPFTPAEASMMALPEFYAGKSSKGNHVFILNLADTASNKTFNFTSVPGLEGDLFHIRDMWSGRDLGNFSDSYTTLIESHDNAALLLTPA